MSTNVNRNRLSETMQQAHDRIYTGSVKQAIRWLGFNKILSTPYWKLAFALSDDTRTHTILNQTVKFRTTTFSEFRRFDDFVGERPVLEDVLRSLDQGDVFYDIGANVGTYTCFVASKLGPGQTVAFEPEPNNVERLSENLSLNHLNAMIEQVALSDQNGTVELALEGDESGEGTHAIATDSTQHTIEVEIATGDSIVDRRELPDPTVLKIDVEGAELSVLRGMKETLREHCRLVYVEVHPDKIDEYGKSPAEVHSLLEEAGFEFEEFERRGKQYFLRAE